MASAVPIGAFACERFELARVRVPESIRSEKNGAMYLYAEGYELAYRCNVGVRGGERLHVHGKVLAELNRQVGIRDAPGAPALL